MANIPQSFIVAIIELTPLSLFSTQQQVPGYRQLPGEDEGSPFNTRDLCSMEAPRGLLQAITGRIQFDRKN